jgi:hypothetical protein
MKTLQFACETVQEVERRLGASLCKSVIGISNQYCFLTVTEDVHDNLCKLLHIMHALNV